MGDARFARVYAQVRDAANAAEAIRRLDDEGLIAALAAAEEDRDPYLLNVLATEAMNRARQKRAVLETSSEGMCVTNDTGRVTWANRAARRILGAGDADLRGEPLERFVARAGGDGEEGAGGPSPLEALAEAEAVADDGGALRRLDGRPVAAAWAAAPVVREGDVEGVVLVFRDATRQRRAEAALQEAHDNLRRTLDALPSTVAVVDADGVILDVNRAWHRFARQNGLTMANDGVGANYLAVCDGATGAGAEGARKAAAGIRDVLAGRRERFRLEYPCHSPEERRWFVLRVAPLRWRGASRAVLVHENVTELREARERARGLAEEMERRVRERTRALEAANRELEAFAYRAAHDIKSPLRALTAFSDALAEDHGEELSGEARALLGRVRESARRMGEMVDGLFQLSAAGGGELRRERVDLSAMARQVAEGLRSAAPGRAVELTVQEGLEAYADPRLTRALLENLLGNAWKYTANEPVARVEVGASRWPDAGEGGEVVFFVRDNGAGFDMARAHRLFQPFQRLHATGGFGGSGVGLATVRRIVERHGGRAWAEGRPGEGATFYFTLG